MDTVENHTMQIERTTIEEPKTVVEEQDAVYCTHCRQLERTTYEHDPIPVGDAFVVAAGAIPDNGDDDAKFQVDKRLCVVLCEKHVERVFGDVPKYPPYESALTINVEWMDTRWEKFVRWLTDPMLVGRVIMWLSIAYMTFLILFEAFGL